MPISTDTTENATENRSVGGSIPPLGTNEINDLDKSASWQVVTGGTKSLDCWRTIAESSVRAFYNIFKPLLLYIFFCNLTTQYRNDMVILG